MKKLHQLPKKTKRIALYSLLAFIVAFIGYQMIEYYTQEEKTNVTIDFSVSETNIASKASCNYTMKQGGARIELSKDFSDSTALPNGCLSSFVKIFSSDGKSVTKAGLTFTYDEKYLNTNEDNLTIVRISEDKKEAYPVETKIDKNKNTLYAKTPAEGMWAIANKTQIKKAD